MADDTLILCFTRGPDNQDQCDSSLDIHEISEDTSLQATINGGPYLLHLALVRSLVVSKEALRLCPSLPSCSLPVHSIDTPAGRPPFLTLSFGHVMMTAYAPTGPPEGSQSQAIGPATSVARLLRLLLDRLPKVRQLQSRISSVWSTVTL